MKNGDLEHPVLRMVNCTWIPGSLLLSSSWSLWPCFCAPVFFSLGSLCSYLRLPNSKIALTGCLHSLQRTRQRLYTTVCLDENILYSQVNYVLSPPPPSKPQQQCHHEEQKRLSGLWSNSRWSHSVSLHTFCWLVVVV